jgi:Na+-translocating ferredoxin:NAD+ oxidoreductase subunit B
MTDLTSYTQLAQRLNELPNGFPPAKNGSHLRLLAHLFTPEEAALAAVLAGQPEEAAVIAGRIGKDPAAVRNLLRGMVRKGLISAGKAPGGLGYALMPFVVGIYEMQNNRIDAELARLFEDYFQTSFREAMAIQPPFQRVVPIGESVKDDLSIAPYETASGIVSRAAAWGVTECICRKQTALIGRPCPHPVENCMVFSDVAGAFQGRNGVKELTQEGALQLLRDSEEAGLVHSVGNTREGNWYICNCCTCSCGILRGMAEGGMASVVAHSGFVCRVDEILCTACGVCAERCPFTAITVNGTARVEGIRCAGCGVCVAACPDKALALERLPAEQIPVPPADDAEWLRERAAWRAQHPA